MPDRQSKFPQIAALLATTQGKLIGGLAIIALVLGIVAEGFLLVTSYYNMFKTSEEARLAKIHADASGAPYRSHADGLASIRSEAIKAQKTASPELKAKILRTLQLIAESANGDDAKYKAYVDVAWQAFLNRDFIAAQAASEKALTYNQEASTYRKDMRALALRAHALMFLGKTDEAFRVYLANKEAFEWDEIVALDFQNLQLAGLSHPLMTEVETALAIKKQ